MKIAQSNILCLINNNSIGIRHIQTVFDNGSTEEHIIVSRHEIQNLILKHLSLHLTMGHTNPHVRHKSMKNILYRLKFLHAVMHEEDLSSPIQLIIDDLSDLIVIKKHDLSLNRNTVRRRSAYNRKVSCTEE